MNFLRLWCADICEQKGMVFGHVNRFRFTCLSCRWRRRYYGKFSDPPYWIKYMLTARAWRGRLRVVNGEIHTVNPIRILNIDPRGHFTHFRCSTIIVLDKIMKRFKKSEKPLLEFCEFFANYPTF